MGNHDGASARARTGAASGSRRPPNGGRPGSRGLTTLSNWPVSRRLFAVIALALVMGLVFGGMEVASAESSATQFGRVLHLAKLGQQDVILAQDLQNERDCSARPHLRRRHGQTSPHCAPRPTPRPPRSWRWPPESTGRTRRTSRPAWPRSVSELGGSLASSGTPSRRSSGTGPLARASRGSA